MLAPDDTRMTTDRLYTGLADREPLTSATKAVYAPNTQSDLRKR